MQYFDIEWLLLLLSTLIGASLATYLFFKYTVIQYRWYRRWKGGTWYLVGFIAGVWSRTPPPYDTMLLVKEEYPE